MATANVLPLKPQTKPTTKPRRSPRLSSLKRHAPAAGLGAVILVLLYLSLNRLARGIQIVTGCESWEGIAMAIGIDLLIVGLECAMVSTAGSKAYKPVARFANPALIAAFLWSAGLNAFAFSDASTVLWMTITAASLGASIPALIYASTRAWAALAINSKVA
jgi:Na+/H+ antiporter NhaD/arsenite permease-like protein